MLSPATVIGCKLKKTAAGKFNSTSMVDTLIMCDAWSHSECHLTAR